MNTEGQRGRRVCRRRRGSAPWALLGVGLVLFFSLSVSAEPKVDVFPESPSKEWLSEALSRPDASFTTVEPVAAAIKPQRVASRAGMGFFLKPEVDPHRLPSVGFEVHAARPGGVDLLRARYEAAGLRLMLLEGRNFVMLRASRIDESLAQAPRKEDYVRALLEQAVKVETDEHQWKFIFPKDFEQAWDACLVSSVPTVPLRQLASRHERADILIRGGEVHFIFYKKIEQRREFLPGDAWFSAQAREEIQERQQAR